MAVQGRKTWLWVLGWIVCFPIPLTILVLRNKKLSPTVRYAIIGATWGLVILLAAVRGCAGKADKPVVEEPVTQEQGSVEEETAKDAVSVDEPTPSMAVQMIPDDTLKAFVQNYEAITGAELQGVEQVGTQGFHATTAGHTIELTYTKDNITVQIDNNGDFEDMREIFHNVANALDSNIGDEAYSLFDNGMAKMSTEEDGVLSTDAFMMVFSIPNEFEDGHIQFIVQK